MKKLSALLIVLTLLAVTATSALAAGGTPPGGGSGRNARGAFALVGTISALDATAQTVTVQVASGNKLVQPYIGQTLTLQTTGATRFLLADPNGGVGMVISFADLQVGQTVSANGKLADNVWTAARITVGASLVHTP